jgi:hypothetical protein
LSGIAPKVRQILAPPVKAGNGVKEAIPAPDVRHGRRPRIRINT